MCSSDLLLKNFFSLFLSVLLFTVILLHIKRRHGSKKFSSKVVTIVQPRLFKGESFFTASGAAIVELLLCSSVVKVVRCLVRRKKEKGKASSV